MSDPEERVGQEIEAQAEAEPVDPTTAREAMETGLMDEDESDEGAEIGDVID